MGIAQTIDVENLLIWAYRDECVAYGDHDPTEPMAVANNLYFMDGLGTMVDGGGRGPSKLPEDAITVEAAVMKLKGYRRGLVIKHATAGNRPTTKWEPPRGYMCDVWGHPTGNPRHLFALNDKKKSRPLACYVRFVGDSVESVALRWAHYLDWWSALREINTELRNGRTSLKAWELADFAVPQYPWEADGNVPAWLPSQVYLTWGKNVDTLPLTVRTAPKTGR